MNLWLRRFLYVATAITASIVVLAPEPSLTLPKNTSGDDGWLVPRLSSSRVNTPGVIRGLVQSTLWGGQAAAATEVDLKASRWRLAGVTGKQGERYVIVQFGDDRILQLKAKEKFPDGTVIAEVRDNGVCVILQGKRRLLPLDGQVPAIIW